MSRPGTSLRKERSQRSQNQHKSRTIGSWGDGSSKETGGCSKGEVLETLQKAFGVRCLNVIIQGKRGVKEAKDSKPGNGKRKGTYLKVAELKKTLKKTLKQANKGWSINKFGNTETGGLCGFF